jgi:hypothetical protein
MAGFQAYIEALKHYIQADEPVEQIQNVIQAFDDYRILTAVRHGPLGIEQLNRYAGHWLNQQLKQIAVGDWFIGRPVMMTYNDYQLGISNGDIGICFKHRTQSQQFEVFFPSLNKWITAHRLPRSMQTAFALTIHKSQGSEFTHTAIVLDAHAEKLLSQEKLNEALNKKRVLEFYKKIKPTRVITFGRKSFAIFSQYYKEQYYLNATWTNLQGVPVDIEVGSIQSKLIPMLNPNWLCTYQDSRDPYLIGYFIRKWSNAVEGKIRFDMDLKPEQIKIQVVDTIKKFDKMQKF